MEYISFHRYIRNTPLDTEVHAEHQLKAGQEYMISGKEYIEACKTQLDNGTGGGGRNRSVSRTGPALCRWGNQNRGLIPISGQLSESEEKYLKLRVKQLICGSINERRIR